MLIASTFKKYVFLIVFDDSVFGQRLNDMDKNDFISDIYGGLKLA